MINKIMDVLDGPDQECRPLKVKTQKERWEQWKPPETLEDCVKLLIEILDTVETSDEGRDFKPTYITSCRVWDSHRLGRLLPKMKDLIALNPHTSERCI